MTLSEFHFIRPYWLLAGLPLLVFIFFSFKHKYQQRNWQAVCDAGLLPFVLQEKQIKHNRMPLIISSLATILAILALAGPAWQRIPTPVFRNVAALVIVLDLSRSMDASDIKPSRLVRARYKIADLLSQRKDGQTALVVYAASAFTVTPLTDDSETINSQLLALNSDIMPAQGSNSALALQHAVQLFNHAGLHKGQILLISDDDKIQQAIENAQLPSAFRLSILAVGTTEGAPIKLTQGGFLREANGNIVLAKLNTRALRKAAQDSGGIYQQMTETDADIERLSHYFEQSAKHHEVLDSNLLLENWVEAGVWLLLPILLLSALLFRRGILSLSFVFLLPIAENSDAFEWQDLWQTKNQQAQQAYLNGHYPQAAEKFTDPAWQAAASYRAEKPNENIEMLPATTDIGFYNQANVLARSGQLEKAISAYDKALKLNPNNTDAQHNKELVEKLLQQQKQDKKDQQQNQSDTQQDQQGDDQSSKQQSAQQKSQDTQDLDKHQQQATESENNQGQDQEKQQHNTQAHQQEKQGEEKPEKPSEGNNQDDEQQQAGEQWLQRIPDDPSGLLRRKFKYQYSQQKQQQNSHQSW